MTADVQYGPAVASVYDAVISASMPTARTLERLRPHISGARVLEIGVGTGRVALPATGLTASLVGVDNSRAMLARLLAKGLPDGLELVEADFRRPLPLGGRFGAAYSTLGSLACVRSRAELTAAFSHVRHQLEPGSPFCFDYYSEPLYRGLAALGTTTVPLPDPGGTATCTVVVDDTDLLTIETTIRTATAPPVHFAEQVLLVPGDDVRRCLHLAGFTGTEVEPAAGPDPYDWYLTHATDPRGDDPC